MRAEIIEEFEILYDDSVELDGIIGLNDNHKEEEAISITNVISNLVVQMFFVHAEDNLDSCDLDNSYNLCDEKSRAVPQFDKVKGSLPKSCATSRL